MRKKLTALLTACLVMLSVFPTNVAAVTKPSTKITASCVFPDIDIEVTVPTDTTAYLNPKKVSVSSSGKILPGQMILSAPSWIENKSLVPISVSASITTTVKSSSTMKLRSSTTAGAGLTTKEAFVYFEMHEASQTSALDSVWDSGYDASKHILVTVGTNAKNDFVTLDEAGGTNPYGVFRLAGDCVANPTTDWNAKDSFTSKIVFTFKALPLS
jgi:hypothetical protein